MLTGFTACKYVLQCQPELSSILSSFLLSPPANSYHKKSAQLLVFLRNRALNWKGQVAVHLERKSLSLIFGRDEPRWQETLRLELDNLNLACFQIISQDGPNFQQTPQHESFLKSELTPIPVPMASRCLHLQKRGIPKGRSPWEGEVQTAISCFPAVLTASFRLP